MRGGVDEFPKAFEADLANAVQLRTGSVIIFANVEDGY